MLMLNLHTHFHNNVSVQERQDEERPLVLIIRLKALVYWHKINVSQAFSGKRDTPVETEYRWG